MTANIERLVELVHDLAFRVGKFRLASGAESDFYVDVRMVSTHPEGSALIGDLLLERIASLTPRPVAIGGLALGAVPVTMAVTARSVQAGLPIATFIARKEAKEHGTGRRIEGYLNDGDPIVIVDDTVTTGGSTLASVDIVLDAYPGCRIVGVFAVVDREEGGRERITGRGLPFDALVTRSDLFRYHERRTGA